MCSGSFKKQSKTYFQKQQNSDLHVSLYSHAKNVSWYVQYHIKTSTHQNLVVAFEIYKIRNFGNVNSV